MHSDVVCGLDIGSSSIRALIAEGVDLRRGKSFVKKGDSLSTIEKEVSIDFRENILGYTESPTRGFSKGVVSNLQLLSDAIEKAVSKLEDISHTRVRKLITNISGVHIRTFKSRGSIHISDRPSEIRDGDLKRCIESAKLIAMSLDREVVHLIPELFYIDDKMEIRDPLGLFGSKLDVDLNIITTLVSILQNLTKAINLAGYEVEEMITSGAATALAIFEQKELEEGAVVIDVGKDLTEVALFMDGRLSNCFYFPFGSDDLTQVLQDKLRIMFEEAEKFRIKYGIVARDTSRVDDSEISIPFLKNRPGSSYEDTQSDQDRLGGNWVDSRDAGTRLFWKDEGSSVISRREISNVLLPKVEEIVETIHKKIEPFLKSRKTLPHICVVGGLSKMDGFIEALEEILGAPVNMGRLRNTKDLCDVNFACSLGLARYGIRRRREKSSKYFLDTTFFGRVISKVHTLFSDYF